MMLDDLGLMISALIALGIAAQWLGWFLKKPAIIFLLGIGILLGPTLHLFNPDAVLGDLLFPLISLGVAIILFEGALTLDVQEIKNHGRIVTNLVSFGVVITITVTAFSAHWIMGMDYQIAFLFGALVCVTGPTVIVPLLRSVRPNRTISNVLRWEGVLIDPIGALLVVLVYEFIIAGHSPLVFASVVAIGLVIGAVSALTLAVLFKHHWVPEYLHNVFTLAMVLLVFSLSNAIEEESGLLTVTVMGMVLANLKNLRTDDILDFKESLSLIIISMLFIVLSAKLDFAGFAEMGCRGLIVLAVIMFIARPLSVWVSALGSNLTNNEKLLISWIAPRGIVAAAVSSLFVLKLAPENGAGVEILVPLVFTIIIGTVVVQSLTAKALASWLGVADPNPNGVLIAAYGTFAILLGKAIKENGFDVIFASTSYDQTRKARMEGMNTYFGNVVSEHADRHLSLVGIGHLLAMGRRNEENMLATLRYRTEFGNHRVYRLKVDESNGESERERIHSQWQTAWLFDDDLSYHQMLDLTNQGATIKTTTISENYPYAQYLGENPENIPLFAITPQQKLLFFSTRRKIDVARNWKVVALVPFCQTKATRRLDEKRPKNGRKEGIQSV